MKKNQIKIAMLGMLLSFAAAGCGLTDSPRTLAMQYDEQSTESINIEMPDMNDIGNKESETKDSDRADSEKKETLKGAEETTAKSNSGSDSGVSKKIEATTNGEFTIQEAGTYVLTGQAENFTLIVDADKEDKVQIELDDVSVTNKDFPVIYVKSADKCFVTVSGENAFSVTESFVSDGDTNTDAVIFSKDDLVLNGTGSLTVLSASGNGITSKDDLDFDGGSYVITSAKDAVEANDSISVTDGTFVITSKKDGLHCENDEQKGSINIKGGDFTITADGDGIQATEELVIDGGTFQITAEEGLEATFVQINDGTIRINASDDGINAARKSNNTDLEVMIEINGGDIKIVMGPGDTDGLDANGTIVVNGGTVDVTGNSTFDADRGSIHNGGTIIINGVETETIPESMMGGHGGKGGFDGGFGGNRPDGGMTGGQEGWPDGEPQGGDMDWRMKGPRGFDGDF